MSVKKLINSNTSDISIGMLPFGILALFGYTDKKSDLLEIYKGEEVVVEDYIPNKLSISQLEAPNPSAMPIHPFL